ncbi:MAG: hypothetical protein IJ240_08020 [Clostridia bacterium]|nr:hypothetical protein [Clostridia bacterium]
MEHKNIVNNDELHIRLRKNQNTLSVIGLGVIAFGVWSVLKGILYAAQSTGTFDGELEGPFEQGFFWGFIAIVLIIDLGLRLYVGRSAIAEARGGKKRRGYIVLASLMALISFALFALSVALFPTSDVKGAALVSIVVDATSCVLLAEMVLAAVRVNRLTKLLDRQEG